MWPTRAEVISAGSGLAVYVGCENGTFVDVTEGSLVEIDFLSFSDTDATARA